MTSFGLLHPAVAAAKAALAEEELDRRVDCREDVTTTPADTVVFGGEPPNWKWEPTELLGEVGIGISAVVDS